MTKGTLISIEGIDGAGKTTLINGNMDTNGLRSQFKDAIYTTEPNDDTWLGKTVRRAINNQDPETPPMSVFFLFLAEHANHVEDVIRPNLEKDKTVICDRYIDSRYAYQSYEIDSIVEGDTLEWIRNIQEQKWTIIPDRTIILDIPVNIAMKRLDGDEIFEKEDKLKYFRDIYLRLAEKDSRYRIVDANQPPEKVVEECRDLIKEIK